MGESPEIKNWKSLWTSLSDAKIGQIWVYHVARVLGEETSMARISNTDGDCYHYQHKISCVFVYPFTVCEIKPFLGSCMKRT